MNIEPICNICHHALPLNSPEGVLCHVCRAEQETTYDPDTLLDPREMAEMRWEEEKGRSWGEEGFL